MKPNAFLLILCASLAQAQNASDGPQARWLNAKGVNLRSQPTLSSEILTRMPLNTKFELLSAGDGKFCEVRIDGGQSNSLKGFVACQYLAQQAVPQTLVYQARLPDGEPNPNYDPLKAFWLNPGYDTLYNYGEYLEETRLSKEQRENSEFVRKPVPEFEKMKAWLAAGVIAPASSKPVALRSFDEIKAHASKASAAWQTQLSKAKTREEAEKAFNASNFAQSSNYWEGTGLYREDWKQIDGLFAALELPAVGPSLFQSQAEIAAPINSAASLSAQFQIPYRIQTKGRVSGSGDYRIFYAGTWDVGQVIINLLKPVTKTTVFADGKLTSANSNLRQTINIWSEADGPMCDGYEDGFAYGSSGQKMWTDFMMGKEVYVESLKRSPKGSLLYFYTRNPLPFTQAKVTVQNLQLDSASTGFSSAKQTYFDLNGDGVIDLAVWEGTGKLAIHLSDTLVESAFQRIFFINIGGKWYLFQVDHFGNGCGC